jgi:hypothetical protein
MDMAGSLPSILTDAIRYWERGRIAYNLVLAGIVLGWFAWTWPHFRQAFHLPLIGALFVLGVLANVCYCAAYIADIPLQHSSFQRQWRAWRWGLWLIGTLFASVLASYWIADEIYPFVG